MNNKLEIGMIFKNTKSLCEFLNWKYNKHYLKEIRYEFSKYVRFHMDKNKIIIDKIINDEIPYYDCIPHKVTKDYFYSIGDILNQKTVSLKIIKQTRVKNGNSTCKGYTLECLNCGYVFDAKEYHLESGSGCPCCSNRITVKGINDINTTNKELSSLLLNYEDGYKYTQFSHQKLDFKCKICGFVHRNKRISDVAQQGLSCRCSNSSSYPNRLMFWFLHYNYIEFYNEKSFDWSNHRKYDFYIPKLNIIIEMNGMQHYKECRGFTRTSLEYQQYNDLYKKNLAITNRIKDYIVIDASKSDFDFIKTNIIKSNLSKYFNIEKFDWNKVKEKLMMNILKEISDIWNSGVYDTNKISKIVGLSRSTTIGNLHKCEEYNLIEKYDKSFSHINGRIIGTEKYYQNYAKPLMCNQNKLCFGNVSICGRVMSELYDKKFHSSRIVKTIDEINKKHHGFTFSYISREQFNKNKDESPDKCYGDYFIVKED